MLKNKQTEGQPIRRDGPESHLLTKQGTPTMGGVLILLGFSLSTLLWADLDNHYIWACLLVTTGFGFIGFLDDYAKIIHSSSAGMSGRLKLLLELVISAAAVFIIINAAGPEYGNKLALPFLKNVFLDLGWLMIPFAMFVLVGASNSVNLTDGLDGLAIMPVIIASGTFAIIAYVVGNIVYADYLNLTYIAGTGELSVFLAAIIGAGLGFLWFNAPPAMIFMGDTGSLALGGIIAVVAVLVRKELLLPILCGIFLIENLSVVIQVGWFKYTKKKYGEGRRVFKMSPLHHHYQKLGYHESKIVTRFWIVGIMLAVITIVTLKLR
jgi:phospho-N-acetylmuramoyl-pentapeptide-transferase